MFIHCKDAKSTHLKLTTTHILLPFRVAFVKQVLLAREIRYEKHLQKCPMCTWLHQTLGPAPWTKPNTDGVFW